MSQSGWGEIVAQIRPRLEAMHESRERGLALCRKLTQTSARSIRHIHRKQLEEASALIEEAKKLSKEARSVLDGFPQLLFAGYLQDAEKELVEAAAVFAIVTGGAYPTPIGLGVDISAYLNGMAEASSECRRYVLDLMREGKMDESSQMLDHMERIYEELITFDYSDSMTGGLRRSCDALRAVIERTRSDLITTQVQQELTRELRLTRDRLL
ncbi:MAG: hypothetical protein HONBIEJF_02754 [Fimbriimonadaceae bacterium]|nr:hypothetical protein [Fimbriimonadaceae bacterium]